MRKLILNIVVLGAFLAGIWVADMVGDPQLNAGTATLGRIVATALGFFAAIGVAALWVDAAEDLDFRDRLRKFRGKGKYRDR